MVVWKRPELLSPAGDWECAKAAVENGADAIYFGLERFNARMRAHNFTETDLPELMAFLHRRGVKGYVTFNTLVFANEMAEAEQYLRTIIAAGVDAAIVQDIGICRLIRQLSPDFPIHASTQMTISSAAGVGFAQNLGCNLVVLARECSVVEVEKIHKQTTLPLETFVHGALCVAYSGQCLTSESLGGRSANRGECAQACRMPYELIVDSKVVDLGDRKYLLSPQDLSGLEVLPELIRAGVHSLKIEGRLKAPEYVANITHVYRKALDQIMAELGTDQEDAVLEAVVTESRYDLEMGFSRGLYTGWFAGIDNQQLVHARFGKKRGVYLGEVAKIKPGKVSVYLEAPLKPGDGVVFDAGHPETQEEGGRVYSVETGKQETWIGFGRTDIDWERIQVGDKLWKTSDPELDRRVRQTFASEDPRYQRPINFEVHGHCGTPLLLIGRDDQGHCIQVESEILLCEAHTQPLSDERLKEQLGRLGGTPFQLRNLSNFLEGSVMLPVSELNRLRRFLVDHLLEKCSEPKRWTLFQNSISHQRFENQTASSSPELIALVRNQEQLEAALESGLKTIYCEFENIKLYRDAVQIARNSTEIFVAPPRIFKTGEEWMLKQVLASEPSGFLLRNYDHLRYFAGHRCIGDFSFNIANYLSAEYLKKAFNLERLTASYDLNIEQLEALLKSTNPEWLEVTIHQHMPMFHMEHCVFCAFLSEGTDFTNCGRPCEKYVVKLRDRVGAEHVLKADSGCRNTVFNAKAQTGAEDTQRLIAAGLPHFRIEFVDETPAQVKRTIQAYQKLLQSEITGRQLWRDLKLQNQLGVTRGSQ
jgi:U32 family peptidase